MEKVTRMQSVHTCAVPRESALFGSLAGASMHDAYCVDLPVDGRSAMALYLDMAARTPAWIDAAMRMRNRLGGLAGLKDLGALSAIDTHRLPGDYVSGERVGIFTLLSQRHDEVVLGDSDKHLDVKMSVHRSELGEHMRVCVSTVVHVRNTLGRAYMLVVAPGHRMIAPSMVRRLLVQ